MPDLLLQPIAKAQIFRASMRGLAGLGLVLPWIFNLRYLAQGGSFAPAGFLSAVSANALTAGITIDIYLAALAFACWVLHERRVRWPWAYVMLCFGVSLSCALPLYLAARDTLKPGPAERQV